jgi:hypothetical protein
MVFSRVLVAASLASIVASTPLQLHPRQNASTPCAQVSASVAAQASAATPTVPAELAHDCITSVPLNKDATLKLLDAVVPYFRWQSNTVWLKDPPAEYAEKVQPAVDIWGELETIRSKVEAGEYDNEFDVCLPYCLILLSLIGSSSGLTFTHYPSPRMTAILFTSLTQLVKSSIGHALLPLFLFRKMARNCPSLTSMQMFSQNPLAMPHLRLRTSPRLMEKMQTNT